MTPVLFLSHAEEKCGVYQFGKQLVEVLKASRKFDVVHCEARGATDLAKALAMHQPRAVLVNWHPNSGILGWAEGWPLWSLGLPLIGIMHEMTEKTANAVDDTDFDYYVVHDPSAQLTNPRCFKIGRFLRPVAKEVPPPSRVTIGSLGFASWHKNFEGLVARVHAEFDDCLIRLNMPPGAFGDPNCIKAREITERCRSLISKRGVELEITYDFMSLDDTVDFLAKNSMNAFFYTVPNSEGISSAIDLALAARRPLAIKRNVMARHLYDVRPSIFVEERSLKEILETGVAPLLPYIQAWTPENVLADYEAMLDIVLSQYPLDQSAKLFADRWLRRFTKAEGGHRQKVEALERKLAHERARAEKWKSSATRARTSVAKLIAYSDRVKSMLRVMRRSFNFF